MFCQTCGTQMPDDSRFCRVCGTALFQRQSDPPPVAVSSADATSSAAAIGALDHPAPDRPVPELPPQDLSSIPPYHRGEWRKRKRRRPWHRKALDWVLGHRGNIIKVIATLVVLVTFVLILRQV